MQGVDKGNDKFHHTGGEGGDGGAGDPQCGQTQLAEDQNVVAYGVADGGNGEYRHAEAGILNALLHTDVDGGEGVENIGEAHDADVGGAQLHQTGIVGNEHQHLSGEQTHGQSAEGGNASCHKEADAHDPVDGFPISPTPELADEHAGAALQTENDELDDIDGYIGHGDGGHLLLTDQTHHEGVHEAKRGGDEVLKDHWQSQCKDPAVEAGLPAKIAEIHKMKFLIQNNKWNPCFVRACT